MNVLKELRDSDSLGEGHLLKAVLHETDELEIRQEDLVRLRELAAARGINVWQAIAVATNRLCKDINELHEQTKMGI